MVGAVLGRRVTTSLVSEAGGDGKGEDREKEGRQDGCVERGVVDGARQTDISGGWVEDGWGRTESNASKLQVHCLYLFVLGASATLGMCSGRSKQPLP